MTIDFLHYGVRQVARPHDIIILPLEYEIYQQIGITKETVQISYSLGLDYFFSLSLRDKIEYFRLIDLERIGRGIWASNFNEPLGRGGYWLLKVNNKGDILQTEPKLANRKKILAQQTAVQRRYAKAGSVGAVSAESFRALKAMAKWARKNQIRLIATYPNSIEGIPIKAKVDAIKAALEGLGIAFLELPHKGFLPIEWMYDSRYHPAPSGAQAHTAIVGTELCNMIPNCRPPIAAAQESVASDLSAFSPFEDTEGLSEIFGPISDQDLPRIRYGYGPASSFSIQLRDGCDTSLQITAKAIKPKSSMTVSLNGKTIGRHAFVTGGFETWDVPVSGKAGFRRLQLGYSDWSESDAGNNNAGKSAFMFKALIRQETGCK